MLRIAAHVLDAAVLERDEHAAGVVAVARAGRAHGLHALMIAGGVSTRAIAAASTARAKRSAMRAASRSCSVRCSSVPRTASGGSPSCSSSAAPPRTTPRAPGRVTSTWNCRPQVVAPTRKAWTQAGLRASTTAPAGGVQRVVVPLVHVELAAARPPAARRSRPPRRTRSAPSRSRPPACAPRCRRVACAISCAPRQMPSTGRPRACASAMTSRSRSSGASPSVPSGLTMPAEHDQPVERSPAGGSGCESAYQVTVRTPRAASGGSSAASGASRSCCTTSTVGIRRSRSHLRPSARAQSPSREGTRMRAQRAAGDGAALHRVGLDLPGDPRDGRDDAAARRGRRALPARGRARRSPCWPRSGASASARRASRCAARRSSASGS